jgi:hypothetical protein
LGLAMIIKVFYWQEWHFRVETTQLLHVFSIKSPEEVKDEISQSFFNF